MLINNNLYNTILDKKNPFISIKYDYKWLKQIIDDTVSQEISVFTSFLKLMQLYDLGKEIVI